MKALAVCSVILGGRIETGLGDEDGMYNLGGRNLGRFSFAELEVWRDVWRDVLGADALEADTGTNNIG